MTKLTKRVVDAAAAGSGAVFIWDDEIKGPAHRSRHLAPQSHARSQPGITGL
jgi:hypothetical protein